MGVLLGFLDSSEVGKCGKQGLGGIIRWQGSHIW